MSRMGWELSSRREEKGGTGKMAARYRRLPKRGSAAGFRGRQNSLFLSPWYVIGLAVSINPTNPLSPSVSRGGAKELDPL